MGEVSGPNASLEQGEATQMKDLVREGGGLATGGSPLGPQPGAQPPGQPPSPAQPQGPPPTQVAAQSRQPMRPPVGQGSPFSPQKVGKPEVPWRAMVIGTAAHPRATRGIHYLAHIAAMDGIAAHDQRQ
jgi:hypothetical protein